MDSSSSRAYVLIGITLAFRRRDDILVPATTPPGKNPTIAIVAGTATPITTAPPTTVRTVAGVTILLRALGVELGMGILG
jgi:hypothetical protein